MGSLKVRRAEATYLGNSEEKIPGEEEGEVVHDDDGVGGGAAASQTGSGGF